MKHFIIICLSLLLLTACGDKAAFSSQEDPSSGGGLVVSQPAPEPPPAPEGENSIVPLDKSAFTEEQRNLINLSEMMYIAHMTITDELSDADKADFFRFIISTRFYEAKREEWKVGEQYIIPLADIETILFTHLDTSDFDPVKGFQKLPAGRFYDEKAEAYVTNDIGGYGGAAALGVLQYTEDNKEAHIVLGSYDMNQYFSSDPTYELIGEYEVILLTEGNANDFKILRAAFGER